MILTWYCRDRVSSCNIYAVQQDTQCGLMSKFYSARHVSDFTGPLSGAFCTSCIRRLRYVVIRVLLDTSNRNGWTCRVVRTVVPHTKVCEYSLCKTLLMMDRWGPKHVELTQVLSKTYSLKTTLCTLLDCIYIHVLFNLRTGLLS